STCRSRVIRWPSSAISPSTVTRPSAMYCSTTRRLATPAAASTFCRRSPSSLASPIAFSRLDIEAVPAVLEQGRDVRQLVERVDAELREQEPSRLVVDRARLRVGERLRDEPAADQRLDDGVDVDGPDR